MFRTITVEREYGSGAAEISRRLAEHLGWKLWDQSLTEEIAKRANVEPAAVRKCDERLDGRFHRLAKIFWRGSYESSMSLHGTQHFDADTMVEMVRDVLTKLADEGNSVIVGRGAPYVLRNRPDVFHVFLYAPRAEKLRRVQTQGKTLKEAEELVDTVDRDRITFIAHYFRADWPTRALYNMMINTALGEDKVLEIILDTVKKLEAPQNQ
ncbi:MAG TPA: cytidylate kinase-like family protein [Terriglobales bacterium]|jgi:cytidylate kinase|nr:cytidylate kinase-like family protein [Terriglobales bacterium]